MAHVFELHWCNLCLGDYRYYSDVRQPEVYVMQWREATATLYIRCRGNPIIDIRLEREIHMLKVYYRYKLANA